MVQVNWTLEAQEDVLHTFRYWTQFSSRYAQELMEELFASTDLLETNPEMGAIETSLSSPKCEYRFLVVKNRYKVVYMYQNNVCDILLVWDCFRDPRLLKIRLK